MEEKMQKKVETAFYQVIGADAHVLGREERIDHTPVNNVQWINSVGRDGKRGMSRCVSMDAKIQERMSNDYGQSYVKYGIDGEPDFRPFTDVAVKIPDMSNDRNKNFASARKAILSTPYAKEHGLNTVKDVEEFQRKNELSLHECSDGVTVQLVPTYIHETFRHAGGVSENNAKISDKKNGNIAREFGKTIGCGKIEINKAGVKAEMALKEAAKIDADLLKESAKQASDVALTAATTSAVHNIFLVAYGEKTVDEAAKDVLETTGSAFITYGVKTYCKEKAWNTAAKLTSEQACIFLKTEVSHYVGKISSALETTKVIAKYVDGELDADECAVQIGITIAGNMAFAAGNAILPPLGGIAAQMIVEGVCNAIYNEIKAIKAVAKSNKQKLSKINAIANEALYEMKLHQDMLRSGMETLYSKWDQEINEGFQWIAQGGMQGEVALVAEGYNRILSIFDKRVSITSTDELETLLLSGGELVF